jgi:hypothetical protein
MFSTVRESENEGNRKVSPRCAETVEQSKFLWKKKENWVRILNQEADFVGSVSSAQAQLDRRPCSRSSVVPPDRWLLTAGC